MRPQVHVAGRREGKTTELVRWLAGGHPLPRWPMWSRVLLVSDAVREQHVVVEIVRRLPALWSVDMHVRIAEQLDEEPSLDLLENHKQVAEMAMRRAVMVASGSERLRGLDHDIEVAIDDAGEVLFNLLGLTRDPARLSITGTTWEPS